MCDKTLTCARYGRSTTTPATTHSVGHVYTVYTRSTAEYLLDRLFLSVITDAWVLRVPLLPPEARDIRARC